MEKKTDTAKAEKQAEDPRVPKGGDPEANPAAGIISPMEVPFGTVLFANDWEGII